MADPSGSSATFILTCSGPLDVRHEAGSRTYAPVKSSQPLTSAAVCEARAAAVTNSAGNQRREASRAGPPRERVRSRVKDVLVNTSVAPCRTVAAGEIAQRRARIVSVDRIEDRVLIEDDGEADDH